MVQLLSTEFRSGIRQQLSWILFYIKVFLIINGLRICNLQIQVPIIYNQIFLFSSVHTFCPEPLHKTEQYFYLECDTELVLDNTECESCQRWCWWCCLKKICVILIMLLEEKLRDFRRGCIALKRFAWEEMLRDFTGSCYTFGEIVWPREERLVDLSVSLSMILTEMIFLIIALSSELVNNNIDIITKYKGKLRSWK